MGNCTISHSEKISIGGGKRMVLGRLVLSSSYATGGDSAATALAGVGFSANADIKLFPDNRHPTLEFVFSSPVAQVVALANELKTDYEAHRVLTAGPVHGAADSTNAVTAATATNLATAITLVNDIKTQYEAHRVLTAGTVHGAADSTNAVAADDATDLTTLITLINEIRTDYEAHRVLTAGSVHSGADSTNVVSETAAAAGGKVKVFDAFKTEETATTDLSAVSFDFMAVGDAT